MLSGSEKPPNCGCVANISDLPERGALLKQSGRKTISFRFSPTLIPVPSFLDLAISSASVENVHVSVLPHLIADHYPIVIKPSAPKRRHPPTTIRSRPWHRVDWNALSLDILNADWDSFYAATDVNTKVSHFMRVWIVELCDRCALPCCEQNCAAPRLSLAA